MKDNSYLRSLGTSLVKKTSLRTYLSLPMVRLVLGLMAVSLTASFFTPNKDFYPLLIYSMLAMPYLIFNINRLRTELIEQFLRENDELSFIKSNSVRPSEYLGQDSVLSGLGSYPELRDLVVGKFEGLSVDLFCYRYSIAKGVKPGSMFFWFRKKFYVCKVSFDRDISMNHILLSNQNRSIFSADLPSKYSLKNILSTNSIFDDNFSIYCSEGYEVNTLKILSPNFMDFLVKEIFKEGLSVEFIDNFMYVYTTGFPFENRKKLEAYFYYVDNLINQYLWASRNTEFTDIEENIRKGKYPIMSKK